MTLQRTLPFALIALLVGCSEDPLEPDPNARVILAAPSFATNINEIFVRRGCTASGCHGAAGGRAGLMLTADAAANHTMLFDVDATSETFKLVLPNDADNSYLVIKLEDRQTVGVQMPRNEAALDNIDLTNIRNWINNGAPNN